MTLLKVLVPDMMPRSDVDTKCLCSGWPRQAISLFLWAMIKQWTLVMAGTFVFWLSKMPSDISIGLWGSVGAWDLFAFGHWIQQWEREGSVRLAFCYILFPQKEIFNDNNFHFCPPSHQATGRNLSICSYFEFLSRKNGLPPTAIYCVVLVKGFSDISTVFSCYIDAGLME